MFYTDVIDGVFSVFLKVLSLFYIHYAVFALAGTFIHKSFPHSEHKNRFGLIIPARNEEVVIATLISSIRKTNYPQELLDIFVVAHNCTDNTAVIARSAGARVYEYTNPEENTMGYAIKFLFERIEEDCGRSSVDGFFIFNADNTLDEKYIDKMNDAFEYYDRKCVISSFRQASNFSENIMTVLYGAYFATSCILGARGRTVLNISNRISGCGYLFNSDLVREGWKYVSITEDLEFSAKEILNGTGIRYCDDAVFYDEQPSSFKIMWRQRLRWARGHILVIRESFTDLARAVFEPERKNRFAAYDMATFNTLPTFIIIVVNLIRLVCLSLSPLFGESIIQALRVATYDIIDGSISFCMFSITAYLLTMLCGQNRLRPVPFTKAAAGMLLFPLFLFFQYILDVQALFSKNLQWKPIPHTGRRDT